jgi:hypothetical protein
LIINGKIDFLILYCASHFSLGVSLDLSVVTLDRGILVFLGLYFALGHSARKSDCVVSVWLSKSQFEGTVIFPFLRVRSSLVLRLGVWATGQLPSTDFAFRCARFVRRSGDSDIDSFSPGRYFPPAGSDRSEPPCILSSFYGSTH